MASIVYLWAACMLSVLPLITLVAQPGNPPLAAVQVKERWGYIDTTGALVLPPWFLQAGDFSEGLAAVKFTTGLWGYIDKRGMIVLPGRYTHALGFVQGQARVKTPDGWRVVNRWGEELPGAAALSPPDTASSSNPCQYWQPQPDDKRQTWHPFHITHKKQGLALSCPAADLDSLYPIDSIRCLPQLHGCLVYNAQGAYWVDSLGHPHPLPAATTPTQSQCLPQGALLWVHTPPLGHTLLCIAGTDIAHSPQLHPGTSLPPILHSNRVPVRLLQATAHTQPDAQAIVSQGEWGYLNTQMKVAIAPVFQHARPFF